MKKIWREVNGRQYCTVAKAREIVSRKAGVKCSISSAYKMLRRGEYFHRAPVKRHAKWPPSVDIFRLQRELAELIPREIEGNLVVVVQGGLICHVQYVGRCYHFFNNIHTCKRHL